MVDWFVQNVIDGYGSSDLRLSERVILTIMGLEQGPLVRIVQPEKPGEYSVRQVSGFGVEISAVKTDVASGRSGLDEVACFKSLNNAVSQVGILGSKIKINNNKFKKIVVDAD
jgi:hypothetical protein